MRKKVFVTLILLAVVFGCITLAISAQGKAKKDDLYRQVSLFSDALAIIQTEYVEEVKPRELIYGALEGMLSALDPHSHFMDPDSYNELKIDREGKFGGLGLEITMRNGLPTVVTPIEDTPAWKAGIKSGDAIVKINDEITRGMTLTDAVKKLRGNPGESVRITIFRESEKKILEFKLTRDVIKVRDIKDVRILEDGIGYIRLIGFGDNTARDLDAALEKLKKEGMNALIFDLRNNPGGLFDSAVNVAERFVEKDKLIVYTKGRKEAQNMEFRSRFNKPFLDTPMVVLINEGSASGSEIIAGCLQDYKRAIIVGIKSFGKGVVQTVIPLSDGSALSLTTNKYFTPLGKEIQGTGVIPDIVAEETVVALTAKDLQLSQKPQDAAENSAAPEKPKEKSELEAYKFDNQILRAIDVLKAVRIYKGIKS